VLNGLQQQVLFGDDYTYGSHSTSRTTVEASDATVGLSATCRRAYAHCHH